MCWIQEAEQDHEISDDDHRAADDHHGAAISDAPENFVDALLHGKPDPGCRRGDVVGAEAP